MKEKLRNMYEEGLLDTTGLLNAVAKDWITITDVIEIVGGQCTVRCDVCKAVRNF